MAALNGLDTIRAILPTLKPKELEELRQQLKLDQCLVLGHRYRKGGIEKRWFLPTRTVLFCERCGNISYC